MWILDFTIYLQTLWLSLHVYNKLFYQPGGISLCVS